MFLLLGFTLFVHNFIMWKRMGYTKQEITLNGTQTEITTLDKQ
jgi:hypothetical protein